MDIIRQAPVIGPLGPLIATFIIGFTTILLLWWYSTRNMGYWKKRGVPSAKTYPIFGSILEIMSKPLHDIELERYQKYGRIYGHFEGNKPLLSVGDADILRNILVKDFQAFTGRRHFQSGDNIVDKMLSLLQGEDWKRVRTIITPTFTTGKIKKMLGIFKECSKTLVKNFQAALDNGEPIEAKSLFGTFTMDIIASSAFSTKIDSHNDPNNKFVATARKVFARNVSWRFLIFFLLPGVIKYLRMSLFSTGIEFFRDVTLQIIEERKRTGQTRNDFLQLLLDTEKELFEEGKLNVEEVENDITDNYGGDETNVVIKNVGAKKSLSRDELIAQCVIFFLAGYDTTGSTLSFVCYLLALNPDIQEKVIEELDNALTDTNGELTYEALQSMRYLDNVISETLRFFPPAVRLERQADEDYTISDVGITVPKGMIVTIPTYAMHRDPEYFPEPEKFDPDRFTSKERAKRNPYTYMPFGAGPRNCVGMRFALMEMKVCLAYIFSNFRVKKCAQTQVPLEFYQGGQGLIQPKNITLQLEKRKDTVKAL